MGYSNGCSVLGNPVQCCLDDSFTPDVNGACCFVENEDLGAADNGASNGNTLTLTARQLGATVANQRVISLFTLLVRLLERVHKIALHLLPEACR